MSDPNSSESTAPNPRFETLWNAAVREFCETTGKNLVTDSSIPKPKTVEELVQTVAEQHGKFSAYTERGAKIREVLMLSLAPVKALGNLAAGGACVAFPPSQMIFGGVMYLINTAENVGAAYDAITDLFSKIEEFTCRFKVHAGEEIPEGLRDILIKTLVTLLQILALSAKRLRHGSRVKKYLECVLLGRDSAINGAIANLDKLTRSELLATTTETLAVANRSAKMLSRLKDDTSDMKESVKRIETAQVGLILREAEEKIQNTLRPKMANIDTYENLKDEIVKGSGEWIRDEILLINWLNRKRPILWIYGFPGAGKSFLSCSIIRYLEQLHPQGVQDVSRVSIGYFFFKNEDPGLRSFNTLLRTVSYQLTKNDPVYAKHVAGLCSSLGDGRSTSTLWKKLFLEFFYEKDTGSSAYIVIDGLDEANDDERERFFELLKSLEQNKGGGSNIQILLVGRPHVSEELEDVLGALPPNMELSPSKSSKDIEKYIHQTVRKSSKLRRRPKKLRDEIVSKLNAGANGFFLWAKLMLKELEMKDREDQMRAALNNLPKGLKNTLQQIVVRLSVTLDKDKVEDLNEILSWVVCAVRPLYLSEIDQILQMRSSEGLPVFDLERLIRYRYASFFAIAIHYGLAVGDDAASLKLDDDAGPDEENFKETSLPQAENHSDTDSSSSLTGGDSDDAESDPPAELPPWKVMLAHVSIRDFFCGNDQPVDAAVHVDVKQAQVRMLRLCLMAICEPEIFKKYHEFVGYAVEFFGHLRSIKVADVEVQERCKIAGYLMQLFRDTPTASRYLEQYVFDVTEEMFGEDCSDENVQALLCWYNDPDVLEHFGSDEAVKSWVEEVTTSPIEKLPSVLAMICARRWLVEGKNEIEDEITFLHFYLLKIQNPLSKLSNIFNYKIKKLSAERIVELAHWAQFEESSKWLTRVAYILLLAGQNKEAVIFAERSVATGAEDPGLLADLAVSYAANRQYQKAMDTLLLSQELISDNDDSLRRVNITRLSRYQERLGDIDAAIESYTRALDGLEVPKALSLTQNFLRLLLTHRKYDQALQIIESLSNAEDMGTSDSALVDFYWQLMDEADIHQELIRLAVETDSLEAVAEFYRRGLRAFVHFDMLGIRSAFRFYYAVLHLRLFQQDKAVRLLEAVVGDPQLSLGTKRYEWMRLSAEFILAVVYLDKALTAQRYDNLQTTEEVVGRLTELAQHERAAKSTRLPAVILGVWHRINGRTEAARACIRGSVMLGVDLLTDDTDKNDVEGWSTLGIGLLAAGDSQNALMVVLYCKQLGMNSAATGRSESVGEDEYTDKEPAKASRDANGQGENEQKTTSEDPADYECDGCRKGIRASQEMHKCSYCLNVDFCGDCYGLYTAGNLPINVCGRHHEFIHVPPVLEAYPRGLIKAGDVYRETSVWLEELRETWAATD